MSEEGTDSACGNALQRFCSQNQYEIIYGTFLHESAKFCGFLGYIHFWVMMVQDLHELHGFHGSQNDSSGSLFYVHDFFWMGQTFYVFYIFFNDLIF